VTPKPPPLAPHPVSPQNPCPFLRALVAAGSLPNGRVPVAQLAALVAATARRGEGAPALSPLAISAVAAVGNGCTPAALWETHQQGVQLNALRGGPLDKRGAGSRILTPEGEVDARELARLGGFAKPRRRPDGRLESGLRLAQLTAYMDANFARAAGHRRWIDRSLMRGEWPVLLQVMGKPGAEGRYLSLRDVTELFKRRRLPTRMKAD
jgi:hypothetical protein